MPSLEANIERIWMRDDIDEDEKHRLTIGAIRRARPDISPIAFNRLDDRIWDIWMRDDIDEGDKHRLTMAAIPPRALLPHERRLARPPGSRRVRGHVRRQR